MTTDLAPQVLENSGRSRLDILENRNVLAARPQSLYVDVSNRCNIKCLICPYHWNGQDMRKADVMPKEIFFKVGRELFPTARTVYLFGGGEVFLHPEWDELFDFATQWSFLPVISTNGMPLNERRTRALVDAGTQLRISFDGGTPATFNRIREGADFHTVVKNIRRLVSYRDAERPGGRFLLRFSVTAYDENIREAVRIVELAAELGVEQVVFHHLMTDRNPLAGHELSHFPELSDETFAAALERGADLGLHVQAPPPFRADAADTPDAGRAAAALARMPGNRHAPYFNYPLGPAESYVCRVPWVEAWIKPNGNVAPCCMIAQEVKLGSVAVETFLSVWNGGPYRELRETVNSPRPPATCAPETCEHRRHQVSQGRLARGADGGVALTSLCPARLSADIQASDVRTEGRRVSARVAIRNTGDTLWLADVPDKSPDESPVGRVRLAAKVLGASGEVTLQDFVRFPLESDVAPGGTAVRQIAFELPEGAHGALLDMVDEGIAWFESMGSRPVPLMLSGG